MPEVKQLFEQKGIVITDENKLSKVLELVKERCHLLPDFVQQASFFFSRPDSFDTDAIKPKWNEAKRLFFAEIVRNFELTGLWNAPELEHNFKEIAAANQIKPGEVLLPLRIMLVGGKFGPHVFDIAQILGKEETIARIKLVLSLL